MPRGRPPKNQMVQNNAPELVDNDTVEKVVKVKHKRPGRSELMKPHTNPGDNAKYLGHSLQLMKLDRPDMTNETAIKERVIEYFTICEQNDMKPSVEGLSLAFGADRKQLWRWVNGVESGKISQAGRDFLKSAYNTITAMMADYMQNGKINPVSGIFLMKNNFGYTDQTEIVVTPNNPLGAETNEEELQKRITDGVVVELPEEDI